MKKIVFVILIISILAVPSLFAQFRLDLAIDVPWKIGAQSNTSNDFVDGTVDLIDKIGVLPFPDAMGAYQWSFGPVNAGVGVRAFSFILESVVWPVVYAELDLSPIVINANVGGLGYLFFGILNDASSSSLIIPDLNIAFKIGKTFRLGMGVIAFTGGKATGDVTPYALYISGRFSILFKKNK